MSRVALTLLLWAGFWVLSIAVAGALASVPIVEARYQGSMTFSGFLAGAAALTVLWALRPRGWFAASGPAAHSGVDPASIPALVDFVGGVSRRTGAAPPERIWLAEHATAFAAVERRFWGLRSRRTVGIGLPLLYALDRNELAAVLAHELGHHLGGHLAFGPWIHRTRRSLACAVEALDESSFFLDLPFRAYGKLFLRVSASVSREQERCADRLSVASCGAEDAASALRKVDALAPLWDVYFEHEVVPVIGDGVRIPLFEGFRRFLAEPRRRPEIARRIDDIQGRPPSPWDSHPPIGERLAAMAECGRATRAQRIVASGSPAKDAGRPIAGCLDLLGGEHAAEDLWYANATRGELNPMSWDELGERAVLPHMSEQTQPSATPDPGTTPLSAVPEMLGADAAPWDRRQDGVDVLSPAAKQKRLRLFVATWLSVALWKRGFHPQVRPGAHLRLQRGELAVEPAVLVESLASGALSTGEYLHWCETVGDEPAAQAG